MAPLFACLFGSHLVVVNQGFIYGDKFFEGSYLLQIQSATEVLHFELSILQSTGVELTHRKFIEL